MKCKLCGKKLRNSEVEYCSTCRAFLKWKRRKKKRFNSFASDDANQKSVSDQQDALLEVEE